MAAGRTGRREPRAAGSPVPGSVLPSGRPARSSGKGPPEALSTGLTACPLCPRGWAFGTPDHTLVSSFVSYPSNVALRTLAPPGLEDTRGGWPGGGGPCHFSAPWGGSWSRPVSATGPVSVRPPAAARGLTSAIRAVRWAPGNAAPRSVTVSRDPGEVGSRCPGPSQPLPVSWGLGPQKVPLGPN